MSSHYISSIVSVIIIIIIIEKELIKKLNFFPDRRKPVSRQKKEKERKRSDRAIANIIAIINFKIIIESQYR